MVSLQKKIVLEYMKVGIIIAMDIEYNQLLSVLGGKPEGQAFGNDIILWHSGIGKVNAAVGAMNLYLEHKPDCILSTGLAGGIDQSMQVRDIVVGSQTVYHDVWCGEGNLKGQVQGLPARFEGHEVLRKAALSVANLKDNTHRIIEGLICTGDQFITNKEALSKIKTDFPDGLACDMESTAIAHVCHLLQVPFLSIRIISDTPGNTENHQQQWSDFLATMGNHSFRFMHHLLSVFPNTL